jgi:hypothetical protein
MIKDHGRINFKASGDAGLGGVLLKLSHGSIQDLDVASTGDFTIAFNDENGVLTVLAYMPQGGGVTPGDNSLFSINGLGEDYEFAEISAADSRGSLLNVVSRIEAPLPEDFELSQNYPNPFNASTRIGFALPEPQQVSLDIYNISGQKVGTLVNGHLEAGRYDIIWNGTGEEGTAVSSGVYFYKLRTDSRDMTRKMSLIK